MKPTPKAPESGGILAFGAHPDDIEFGCGAVVARETQLGQTAHFVVCSRGESASSGTPEQREAEATAAAAQLGAGIQFIDLGGDAHLEHRVAHALVLAALIRRLKPRVVLAPTVVESQHPDHAVVGRLARDASRLARYAGIAELRELPAHSIDVLFHYAVTPDGEPAGEAPVLIDVSPEAVMSRWVAAMQAHATQLKTRNYVDLQLTRSRLLGLRAGVEHAIALYPAEPLVFPSLSSVGLSARRF